MAGKKRAPYGPLRSGLTQMRTASVMDPDAPDEARNAELLAIHQRSTGHQGKTRLS